MLISLLNTEHFPCLLDCYKYPRKSDVIAGLPSPEESSTYMVKDGKAKASRSKNGPLHPAEPIEEDLLLELYNR